MWIIELQLIEAVRNYECHISRAVCDLIGRLYSPLIAGVILLKGTESTAVKKQKTNRVHLFCHLATKVICLVWCCYHYKTFLVLVEILCEANTCLWFDWIWAIFEFRWATTHDINPASCSPLNRLCPLLHCLIRAGEAQGMAAPLSPKSSHYSRSNLFPLFALLSRKRTMGRLNLRSLPVLLSTTLCCCVNLEAQPCVLSTHLFFFLMMS